jgi:ABC-type polar amino acid transport system ATPase subunit
MTIEEEFIAVGRIVLQRSELRKRNAVLENEVRTLVGLIATAMSQFPNLEVLEQAISAGGLGRLKSLINEQAEAKNELAEVEALAVRAGL